MDNPLKSISALCEKRPYSVIGIILLITLIFSSGIPLIEQDVDMESYLPADNEALVATNVLSDLYGSQMYESILIRGDITSYEAIMAIKGLQQSLLEDPQLVGYIDSATSYLDYLFMAGLLPEEADESFPIIIEQILAADKASGSPQFVGRVVSEDLQHTIITLQVRGHINEAGVPENAQRLMDAVEEFSNADNGLSAGITGDHTQSLDMMEAMNRDNRVLMSIAVVFILLVLFFIFRNISDTVFPYLTIGVAMLWILGTMGFLGIPFTMALVSLIPLMLGICINYAIHIMFRYREERRNGKDVYEGIKACVSNTGTAVFISALTTIIGFSSFLVSELVPMRQFGFLAMIGIFFAFLLVVTLLPALTTIRDRKRSADDAKKFSVLAGGVSKMMDGIVKVTIHHKKPLLFSVMLVTVLSLGLSTQVGTAINWNDMMPGDIGTMQVATEMEELFESSMANRIYVLVEGDIFSPEAMAEVLELENSIRSLDITNVSGDPIISSEYSVSSYVDVLLQANNGMLPATEQEAKQLAQGLAMDPQTQRLIGQYLVLNPLSKYYNSLSIVHIDTNVLSDKDIERAVTEIEGFYSDESELTYRSAGILVIMSDIMGGMMQTQIKTTIVAMILCFLAVSLIMRSSVYGFLAILTVALSISWEFLLLYIMGWQFDLFTIMISAMIVGLGIDFSVHIIERFREEISGGRETEEAIDIVIMNVGKALLTATITTSGAFLIISMSMMPMVYRFGMLSGMVLIFSFVSAIFVLPPILAWISDRERARAAA